MNELLKSEFKITGFDTKQELLEHQVKEYQAFMREQTAKIEELEKKLKVAVEALVRISEIGYYHDYGDHRQVASEALENINGKNKI